jgi:hypothetical protein
MNDNNGLRGGRQPTIEEEGDVKKWRDIYRAQNVARDELKQEKLRSGGDEGIFRKMRVHPGDIPEGEDCQFSSTGVLLDVGVHRIAGAPGTGKTRYAYWEVIDRVMSGQKWAILDAEMGQIRYKRTMKQLGATDQILNSINYMDALEFGVPDILEHGRALSRLLQRDGYHGILYDSQIAFLGASGISENDAHDVRNWTMSASGVPCAIILDHTGHGNDSRGRGTSDKPAGCDVDLILRAVKPFTMEFSGGISITVNKDRFGLLATGSSIYIDVECLGEGRMNFVPGDWDIIEKDKRKDCSVAEYLGLFILGVDRDYALAGELLAQLIGQKQSRLDQIEIAVANGEIIETRVGNSKHYTLP